MSTTTGEMRKYKVTDPQGNVYSLDPVDSEARQQIDDAELLQFDEDYFTADEDTTNKEVKIGLNGVPIGVETPLHFTQDTAQGIVIGLDYSALNLPEMTGATASTDGESGLVPAPDAGDQDKYLKGDGTWANVPVAVASTSGAGGTDGLMPSTDKEKLDGITDYVVSAAVSGSTLTLTPKTGSTVAFTASGEANVIESVKLGSDTLTPASKVVTIPMLTSTTNGAVTAPAAANRNHYSFLDGMGDWSMLEEVSEADIDAMFMKVTIGGREYKVVRIGNQEWLAENLDYKFDVNGSPIELNSQSMTIPSTPAAWYYNRNEATYGVDGEYKCGLLYNGFAARYLEANKDNLLPNRWHIPTTAEWNTLVTACGGASVAGKKLKALNNSITSNWPSNWNGTDDYGFDSIPVGMIQDMEFQLFGTKNHIWSSTEKANQFNDMVTLSSGSDDLYITYYSIYTAMSIRLVKTLT